MLDFIARLLLVSIFLWSGLYNKLRNFGHISERLADLRLPWPRLLTAAAAALEIAGSVVVLFPGLFGSPWVSLTAVLALAAYTMLTAVLFHPFWAHTGPVRQGHLVNFLKNVGLTGAFLLLISRPQ